MSLEEIDAKITVLLPHGISNLTPVQWVERLWEKMDNLLMYRTTILKLPPRYDVFGILMCMTHMSYCFTGGIGDWIVYWQLSHGASNILFGSLFGACAEWY